MVTCILGHRHKKSNKHNLTDGLIFQAQELGARVVDLSTGEIMPDQSFLEGGAGYGGCPSKSSLSKAHIRREIEDTRPRIEYAKGASLIRTTKDIKTDAVGGGLRGGIKGFSIQSRRRMLEMIACVKRDAELPCFVTITYPGVFPTVARSKRDLKVFIQRMIWKFPEVGGMWKLEPQHRGAPHFHMLIWNIDQADLFTWVVENWYQIAGNGDINHKLFHLGALKDSEPCVTKVNSFKGVWFYAAKYIGKTFEVAEWGKTWTGRFWGVIQRNKIPFGEVQSIDLPLASVVQCMRYQRRFMSMRKRKNLNSLKTFCDADQWVDRLIYKSVGRARASASDRRT